MKSNDVIKTAIAVALILAVVRFVASKLPAPLSSVAGYV